MPELPEVQTVVTSLRPKVVGRIIRSVQVYRADVIDPPGADLVTHLTGKRIRAVDRRGKRIIFTLDDARDSKFFIHLGMTGRLTIHYRRPTPLFRELRVRAWVDRVEGRRVLSRAEMFEGDTLTAEADGVFIQPRPELAEKYWGPRDD